MKDLKVYKEHKSYKGNVYKAKLHNFERSACNWEKVYRLVRTYFETYGHIKMSHKFKTFDGITHNENGILLKQWLYREIKKMETGMLSDEQIRLLKEVYADSMKRKSVEEKIEINVQRLKENESIKLEQGVLIDREKFKQYKRMKKVIK